MERGPLLNATSTLLLVRFFFFASETTVTYTLTQPYTHIHRHTRKLQHPVEKGGSGSLHTQSVAAHWVEQRSALAILISDAPLGILFTFLGVCQSWSDRGALAGV